MGITFYLLYLMVKSPFEFFATCYLNCYTGKINSKSYSKELSRIGKITLVLMKYAVGFKKNNYHICQLVKYLKILTV